VRQTPIKSDLARIDRMRDADIDYSDIPALSKTFLRKANVVWPRSKKKRALGVAKSGDAAGWEPAPWR